MKFTHTIFQRIPTWLLAVALIAGSLVWLQTAASPAAAESPDDAGMSVQIVPEMGVAGLGTTPVFKVGDTFKVSIVAQNVTDPGLFGGQFEVTYQTEYLEAVADSLTPGAAMQPVVVAVSQIDPAAGVVKYAASRQGNVTNLTGNIVLATINFKAVGATEPPEGATTIIHLQSVKLGAKGGVDVPVAGLVDLEVIIREDGSQNGKGDMAGNVKVEGRADANQAGNTITAVGAVSSTLTANTDANGHFVITEAPAGAYTVTADRDGFLAAACADVAHQATALTTLANLTLLAGDINNDSLIDITDAVAIGAVFGNTTAGEIADLNADGVVDILDLILMAANFGQTSAANPWVCQPPATEM